MSNIGFMENTVKHIEKLFNYYFKNKKSYPTALEKEDYRNFIFQMEKNPSLRRDGRRSKIQKVVKNSKTMRLNTCCITKKGNN